MDKELVRFEYSYDPDFREYYVTGARGGLQNIYHLRMYFYKDKLKFRSMNEVMIEHKDGQREIRPEDPVDGPRTVERKFIVGLNLSFNAVRELSRFLHEKVKEIDGIERKLQTELYDEEKENDSV